jgi:hypothetical protein
MKNSRIFWLIGAFLIGFGGGLIHVGLGIMAAGFMCLLYSYCVVKSIAHPILITKQKKPIPKGLTAFLGEA